MTPAIHIEGLGKTYPRTWANPPFEALSNLSLTVSQGEVFGFIGPNGAGKSTTIKILTGVMSPTVGTAQLFSMPVADPKARRGLGYVPENPSLYDYLTPLEFLLMGFALHELDLSDPRGHAMKWLERFGLSAAANRRIRDFSKGMAQRTALAHALAVRPKLLILDEPLSGLDPVGRKDVVDILEEFRNAGGTIFLTSHVLHDVERLADRYGLIDRGQLRTIQSPDQLLHGEQMVVIRSFGTQPIEVATREAQSRWRMSVRRDELWPALDTLRTAGHHIVEIRSTQNLEDAFFRYLGLPTAHVSAEKAKEIDEKSD